MNYKVSPKLVSNLKTIAVIFNNLKQQKLNSLVLFELQKNALELSSFSSTNIEGNPLPLTEVKRILKNAPTQARNSEIEVLNYNEALLWIHEQMSSKKIKFNESFIFSIHKIVTKKLLLKSKSGFYRKEPVFVNSPKLNKTIFWPPDHQDVPDLMKKCLLFINENSKILDPILLAGIFHKQFVIIHPFIDGNGRTVRLLTKALLAILGIDTFHLFSFENYYNQNVTKYFDQVGVLGNYYDIASKVDMTSWLEYFTDGIIDELYRVQKNIEQHESSIEKIKFLSHEIVILNYIDETGSIKDNEYAKLTSRAKATRALDFKKLCEHGIIKKMGKGPATYYIKIKK